MSWEVDLGAELETDSDKEDEQNLRVYETVHGNQEDCAEDACDIEIDPHDSDGKDILARKCASMWFVSEAEERWSWHSRFEQFS